MNIFKACVSGRSKKATVMYSTSGSMVRTDHTTKEDPNMSQWLDPSKEEKDATEAAEEERIAFYNSGLAVCIRCGERNLRSQEMRAGARNDGTTHGNDVFTCHTDGCGWTVSYLYDDASADSWHYEAMGWPRDIHGYPVCYMLLWAKKHKLPNDVIQKIKDNNITGSKLLTMAKCEEKSSDLQHQLNVNKKTSSKIRKAIAAELGTVLA